MSGLVEVASHTVEHAGRYDGPFLVREKRPARVQSPSPMHTSSIHIPILILFACLVGCGSGEPLRVASIQLGRSLNADGTVAGHTTSFARGDTVYVSIVTTGLGSATIGVRWMYGGRVVGAPKKQVSYRDVAATEFHLQSESGFPPGDYTVEAFVDGQAVGTRTFRVDNRR